MSATLRTLVCAIQDDQFEAVGFGRETARHLEAIGAVNRRTLGHKRRAFELGSEVCTVLAAEEHDALRLAEDQLLAMLSWSESEGEKEPLREAAIASNAAALESQRRANGAFEGIRRDLGGLDFSDVPRPYCALCYGRACRCEARGGVA